VSRVAKAANMNYVSIVMNKMRNAKYQLGQVVKH
jgi:heat shock protein HspQ